MTKNAGLPEIETTRLILRTYQSENANDLLAIWTDPDLVQYFPPSFRERTELERHEYIARIANLWLTRGFAQWGIFCRENNDLIGCCGLQWLDGTPDVELYYGLIRSVWGRGRATEAARAVARFAFEALDLPLVTALTFPANIASQRILQKLGFRCAGARTFYQRETLYFDLSRKEYEQTRDSSFYRLRRRSPPLAS